MTVVSNFPNHMQTLSDPDLGVTMIARPEIGFAAIDAALGALGFRQERMRASGQPLLDGEPNAALWTMGGGNPTVVYSFNPVARLRVLEVGTLPPPLRCDLREKLPILTAREMMADLRAPEDRQRLRALWGLVALEWVEARQAVAALARSAGGPVGEEAGRAAARLDQIDAARLRVLAGVRIVAAAVMPVIDRLADPKECAALFCRPADCARLFTADAAPGMARLLAEEPLEAPEGVDAPPAGVEDVTACPAGLLRSHNPLSRHFPIGYRSAAGWLTPDLVWVAWRATARDGTHFGHDGLVFCDGRWLFFPRPFRLLQRVVPARPGGAAPA